MIRLVGIFVGILTLAAVAFAAALPLILQANGLHPDYDWPSYKLPGKRALIVTTSHGTLNKPGETKGKKTGVFGSELSVPYYDFLGAGMSVDVASIDGGVIPIDPVSYRYMIVTDADKRAKKDAIFQSKVTQSLKIDDVDFTQYDIIFLAGGWGAAYDLGQSQTLGIKISDAFHDSNAIIGGVCHGPLGLIQAKDVNGNLLIAGRRITGVTDKQIEELGITFTPLHPESALRKAGVVYESKGKFRDLLATHVVVDDEGRFVTGQNQNSGHETAHEMMRLVAAKS